MDSYKREQLITDKYGDEWALQIAHSFFPSAEVSRVTDTQQQYLGADYYFWPLNQLRAIKQPLDFKFDFYDNSNFAFELTQQYLGIGETSWIEHSPDIWIAYIKIALKKCFVFKLGDLQQFRASQIFTNRKVMTTNRTVNGKAGTFKNFSLNELPVHHVVPLWFGWTALRDPLLLTKESLSDSQLYNFL